MSTLTKIRTAKIPTAAPATAPAPDRTPSGGFVALMGQQLPRWAPLLVVVGAVAVAALAIVVLGWSALAATLLGVVVFHVAMPIWSHMVEGPRKAKDRLAGHLVWTAFALAMFPLVTLMWQVVSNGFPALSTEFFTYSMRNVVGEGGGIYHAILGTLIITAWATAISVPVRSRRASAWSRRSSSRVRLGSPVSGS